MVIHMMVMDDGRFIFALGHADGDIYVWRKLCYMNYSMNVSRESPMMMVQGKHMRLRESVDWGEVADESANLLFVVSVLWLPICGGCER